LQTVVLAHPSSISESELVKTVRKLVPRTRAIVEDGFVVFETQTPVELASKLESVAGVKQVSIARKVPGRFKELAFAISETGRTIVLPGERFFVKVVVSEKLDFTARDVEFYSTGTLAAKLSSIGARPARDEHESDKAITAYVAKSAYVCIKTVQGAGGAPLGSRGKACCVITGIQSEQACHLAIKSGFDIHIFLLYTGEDDLLQNAKLAEKISKAKNRTTDTLGIGRAVLPKTDSATRELLMEKLVVQAAISLPEKKVIVPFSLATHPQWFIESCLAALHQAGKTVYAPLMFAELAKKYAFSENLQKYKATIKDVKSLKLEIGPNYLYDIVDSV